MWQYLRISLVSYTQINAIRSYTKPFLLDILHTSSRILISTDSHISSKLHSAGVVCQTHVEWVSQSKSKRNPCLSTGLLLSYQTCIDTWQGRKRERVSRGCQCITMELEEGHMWRRQNRQWLISELTGNTILYWIDPSVFVILSTSLPLISPRFYPSIYFIDSQWAVWVATVPERHPHP